MDGVPFVIFVAVAAAAAIEDCENTLMAQCLRGIQTDGRDRARVCRQCAGDVNSNLYAN